MNRRSFIKGLTTNIFLFSTIKPYWGKTKIIEPEEYGMEFPEIGISILDNKPIGNPFEIIAPPSHINCRSSILTWEDIAQSKIGQQARGIADRKDTELIRLIKKGAVTLI